MKQVPRGSFLRLSEIDSLWQAWQKYKKGKGRQWVVASFDLDADQNIFSLHRRLRAGEYHPGAFRIRTIRDPKPRLITAQPVIDRVLQHALLSEIAPWYERGFIQHQYTWGKGRGPHRALLYFLDWNRKQRWRLSLDIASYFRSIRSDLLMDLFKQRLRDPDTLKLLSDQLEAGRRVWGDPCALKSFGPTPPDQGLPIGTWMSQWSGAFYLNGLDHFIKRSLKIRCYLRYQDDFCLFSDDYAQLETAREKIRAWLWTERRLKLNPKHWRVLSCKNPMLFLGYRVSRSGITPGGQLRRKMKRKLKAAVARGPDALTKTLNSYRGLLHL